MQSDSKKKEVMVSISEKEFAEYKALKALWEVLDEQVKFFLNHLGDACCFSTRMNKQYHGVFHDVKFKVEAVLVGLSENSADYTKKVNVTEQRLSWREFDKMSFFDFVSGQTESPME